jgi:hypothetical protein
MGRSVDVVAADLNARADLKRIETLLATRPGLTMLVNNAGVGASRRCWNPTSTPWSR